MGHRTVRVSLAEAPTDVLVWLCERSDRASFSMPFIHQEVAPEGASGTGNALRLLLDLGYVQAERIDGAALFRATAAGRAAVAAATADPVGT